MTSEECDIDFKMCCLFSMSYITNQCQKCILIIIYQTCIIFLSISFLRKLKENLIVFLSFLYG